MNRTSRPLLMATIASVVAVTGASALGVAASAAPAAPHHANAKHSLQPYWASSGHSYASLLQVGTTVQSAKSALTQVGCGTDGTKSAAATPKLNLGGLGTIGSVTTNTTSPSMDAGKAKTVSGSQTADISLLGGIIQAQALTSTAWAEHLNTTATGAVTKLVGMTVLGLPVDPTPAPNTTIPLPGIGSLTLNLQKQVKHDGVLTELVTGLKLQITKSVPGLPTKGTELLLGHSSASIEKLTTNPLGGNAYGEQVIVPGLLNAGQTFRNILPCTGTGNKPVTESGVGVNLGALLDTGAITTTVLGSASANPKSITSATISKVNLLDGLVTANVIKARAFVQKVKGKAALVRNSNGTALIGLTIAGKSISAGTLTPNTKYSLAGVGTLWLDRTIRTARGVQVHAIELDLGTEIDGYAAGTVVTVGDANARINS